MNHEDLWPWERPQLSQPTTTRTLFAGLLTVLYVLFAAFCIVAMLAAGILLGVLALAFGAALLVAVVPTLALRAWILRLNRPKTN